MTVPVELQDGFLAESFIVHLATRTRLKLQSQSTIPGYHLH